MLVEPREDAMQDKVCPDYGSGEEPGGYGSAEKGAQSREVECLVERERHEDKEVPWRSPVRQNYG